MKIAIINGANLNLLGKRETNIYGTESFDNLLPTLRELFPAIELSYFQSNIEGELVNAVQEFGFSCTGIVINPGAYSHTSVAIADAVAAVPAKIIEVHISNIFAREEYRKHSFVSAKAIGVISGLGLEGYRLALSWLSAQQHPSATNR